jgi:hypothetical protein
MLSPVGVLYMLLDWNFEFTVIAEFHMAVKVSVLVFIPEDGDSMFL